MSVENVKSYSRKFGMEERVIEFNSSSAAVKPASQAQRYRKIQGLYDRLIVVLTAGDCHEDNAKYRQAFQCRKKIKDDDLKECIGHPQGGIMRIGAMLLKIVRSSFYENSCINGKYHKI